MSSGSKKKMKKKKGSSVKEPSFKVLFMEPLAEKFSTTRAFLYSSIKVPSIRAPPYTRFPSGGKGLSWRTETFLTYLPGFPVKELPPNGGVH
jgi:hypothetical protein